MPNTTIEIMNQQSGLRELDVTKLHEMAGSAQESPGITSGSNPGNFRKFAGTPHVRWVFSVQPHDSELLTDSACDSDQRPSIQQFIPYFMGKWRVIVYPLVN